MKILMLLLVSLLMTLLWPGARTLAQDNLPAAGDLLKALDQESLFVDWPGVDETVEHAIEFLPNALRGPHWWQTRQKISALVPTFRYQKAVDEGNYSQSRVVNDPMNSGQVESLRLTDGVQEYDSDAVTLTWDLSRFVFDIDEVDGAKAEREIEEFRRKVRAETITAYFELREMRTRLAQGMFAEKQDRLDTETEAGKLQALLDVYTDGFFSEHIRSAEIQREAEASSR